MVAVVIFLNKKNLVKKIILISDYYRDLQFLGEIDDKSDIIKAELPSGDSVEEKYKNLSEELRRKINSSLVKIFYETKKEILMTLDQVIDS